MAIESILAFIVIGAVAGWLAGKLMKGGGYGLFGNIVVGVLGAFIGNLIFNAFNIHAGGIIGSIVIATVGAGILLFVVGLIKKN